MSGWEFGTNADVNTKANNDIEKSEKAVTPKQRREKTFVFVTPRRWLGKDVWAAKARKRGQWKDVRAYDASDLEQWVEQSIPAQVWFANETKIPASDVRSLERCWEDWAIVCSPPLTETLFSAAIEMATRSVCPTLVSTSGGANRHCWGLD